MIDVAVEQESLGTTLAPSVLMDTPCMDSYPYHDERRMPHVPIETDSCQYERTAIS